MHRFCVSLPFLLGIALPSASHAQDDDATTNRDEIRVGVVILAAINLNAEQADEIAVRFADALGKDHLVDTLAGGPIRAALDAPVSETCVKRRACVTGLGKHLTVDTLLFVTIVRVSNRIQLDVTPANARTGTTESRTRLRVGDIPDQQRKFAAAISDVLPDAQPRPPEIASPGDGDGDGNRTVMPITDGSSGKRITLPVWIAGGVGVVALVSGIALGESARGLHSELQNNCAPAGCVDDPRYSQLKTRINLADASFAVAIIAGATAGALYFFSSKDGDKRVAPAVSARTLGFVVSGRF